MRKMTVASGRSSAGLPSSWMIRTQGRDRASAALRLGQWRGSNKGLDRGSRTFLGRRDQPAHGTHATGIVDDARKADGAAEPEFDAGFRRDDQKVIEGVGEGVEEE